MTRIRCTVAYVGAAYDGWQSQKLGLSVQEKIEEAIRSIAHEKVNILASGRTDAGVSAKGQVFHFDCDMDIKPKKWMGALNGRLPKDIHIMDAEEVSPLFHARYCVRKKQYDYLINLGPYDVFTKDIAYQCPIPLDIEKMVEGSKYLIGTHDFTSYNSNPLSERPDQVRTVFDIRFAKEGDLLRISYIGNGFLRYMVRMMTGQLIEVGRGRLQPEDIGRILDARSKTAAHRNAPACGLTLVSVDYYELLAKNEEGMIREFLAGEELPEGMTLAQIEEAVRERKMPRVYAVTTRDAQRMMGMLEVSENPVIRVYDEADRETVRRLQEQLPFASELR